MSRFDRLLFSVPYAGEDLVIAVQQLAERFDDDGRVIGKDERGAAHRSMLQEPHASAVRRGVDGRPTRGTRRSRNRQL